MGLTREEYNDVIRKISEAFQASVHNDTGGKYLDLCVEKWKGMVEHAPEEKVGIIAFAIEEVADGIVALCAEQGKFPTQITEIGIPALYRAMKEMPIEALEEWQNSLKVLRGHYKRERQALVSRFIINAIDDESVYEEIAELLSRKV